MLKYYSAEHIEISICISFKLKLKKAFEHCFFSSQCIVFICRWKLKLTCDFLKGAVVKNSASTVGNNTPSVNASWKGGRIQFILFPSPIFFKVCFNKRINY